MKDIKGVGQKMTKNGCKINYSYYLFRWIGLYLLFTYLSRWTASLKRSACFGGSFFLSTARFLNTILGDDLATEGSDAVATEVLATAARGPGGAGVGDSDISLNFSFGIDGVFGALKVS